MNTLKASKPLLLDFLLAGFVLLAIAVFFPPPTLLDTGCRVVYAGLWQERLPFIAILVAVFISVVLSIFNVLRLVIDKGDHELEVILVAISRVIFLTIFAFTLVYFGYGVQRQVAEEVGLIDQFFDAAYFSVVTFTTLGYGDYAPCDSMKFFAAMQALLGVFILPFSSAVIVTEYSLVRSESGRNR